MISVIVYGRNDAHGYNLHRRAALSLNCLAEVLTETDDEIVFVDYNTPDELPTFVEAISDTLTGHCLSVLRVLRVPASVHSERFAARTHLPAIEPVARNAAARRANPSNPWLLSTNTDMIFLPLEEQSLSEICSQALDGFYGLPRFELPEWLWEQLPRSDPGRALAEVKRVGPALHLDEPTTSHEWIRFDAPGDFQLVLRKDFFAIDGFDEEMLLGYHVDSNLSRRMFLRCGAIQSLGEHLAGYHCNHSRTPTVYHGPLLITNDLHRFFFSIDQAELPAQRETWGLADARLEEVPVRRRVGVHFADSVLAAVSTSSATPAPSDAGVAPFALTYDSAHILPFIADSLVVSPPDATIGYLGANAILEGMLTTLVTELAFTHPLARPRLDDAASVDDVARRADVLVVDLGLDVSRVDVPINSARGFGLPAEVAQAFAALQRLVEIERARLKLGAHPRRLVLVNSSTVYCNPYVVAQLDCSYTTTHSRVRRAIVKTVPDDGEDARAAIADADQLVRWSARNLNGGGYLQIRPDETIEIADVGDYLGFGEGWAFPEDTGIWTQGSRSELAISFDGIRKGDWRLVFSIHSVCVELDGLLKVDLMVNGAYAATHNFALVHPVPTWRVALPTDVGASGTADVALLIEEPRSPLAVGWSTDERRLGILIRALALEKADRPSALRVIPRRLLLYLRAKIGFRRHILRLRARGIRLFLYLRVKIGFRRHIMRLRGRR